MWAIMRVKYTIAIFKVNVLLVTQLYIVQNYVIVNVWACARYGKYQKGIMIAPKGQSLEVLS